MGFLPKVIEDLPDHLGVFDAGNHLHRAGAFATGLSVDIENTLEPLSPGQRRSSFCGCWPLLDYSGLVASAPLWGCHQRSVFAVRRKHTGWVNLMHLWRYLEMTKKLITDREKALKAISDDPFALELVSEELRAVRDFNFDAWDLCYDSYEGPLFALEWASEELRADRDPILGFITIFYGVALQHASEELRADREFVMEAVEQSDGFALEGASEELKADKEVVLAAVSQYADALEYAADELKADKEVVLAAVNVDGRAFEYASEELKACSKIWFQASTNSGQAPRKCLHAYIANGLS